MSYSKNVVEDALFQIKNLEETLQENAKGILQSTMSEEIKQLVKESLREQDEDEIEPLTPDAEETDMEDDEMAMDDDDEMEDDEFDMDDDEMAMDDDEMDDEDDEMDDETIDMTDASDSEVLRVFKAMGDEDGIIVKKEGGNIHLTDGEDEYMIRLGESELGMETEDAYYDGLSEDDEMYGDDDVDLEGAIYEIEMDDEDDDSPLEDEYEEDEYEIEVDEDNDFSIEDDDEMEFKTPVRDAIRSHKGRFETPMRDRLRSRMEDNMGDDMEDIFRSRRQRDYEDDMAEGVDPEMEEMYGGNKHDFKRSNGHKMGDVDGHYKDYEMEEMHDGNEHNYEMEEDMESDSVDLDTVMEAIKKTLKAKGVGIGKGPKFAYDKKPNMGGGFDQKRKEAFGKGTKAMGTGKAKFEYKQGENMEKGSMKKVETKEASRTYGNGSKDGSRGLRKARTNNRNFEYNPFKISESTNQEVQLLKDKNEEYKKALDIFRTKLNEVAVFNSNLAYATRLFTEHSTTKQEKINVLRRFDNVESLKESKSLYRSIKSELNSGGSSSEQKITESIERTVNRSVESGSAANLIESKTYENPQFLRMKDLMSKL
jgi:hypothetical protein